MRLVQTPSVNDVLCGRVSGSLTHFGNETFRRIVLENKPLYSSSKKLEKIEISRSIVRTIQQMNPPGSFLEYNDTKNLWVEIDEKRAVSKTSQALRESRTLNRNKLKEKNRNNSKEKNRNNSKEKEKSLFKSIADSTSGFIIRNLNLLSSFSSDVPSLCDDSTLRDSLTSRRSSLNVPSLCDDSTFRDSLISTSSSSNVPSLCDDSTFRGSLTSRRSSLNVPSLCDESTYRDSLISTSSSSNVPSLCDDSTFRGSLTSRRSSVNVPSLCDDSTLRESIQSLNTVESIPAPISSSSYKVPWEDDFNSACRKITGNGKTLKDELLSFGEDSSGNIMDFQDQKMNNPKDEEINLLIYETFVLKDIDKQEDSLDNHSINSIEVFDQKLKCPVHHYDATKHNQDFAIENMTLSLPCLENVQKKSSMGKAA